MRRPIVVVTPHAPCIDTIPAEDRNDPLGASHASDSNDFAASSGIDVRVASSNLVEANINALRRHYEPATVCSAPVRASGGASNLVEASTNALRRHYELEKGFS